MAELFSLTSLYILLGVLAILAAVFWALRRATGWHGTGSSGKEAVDGNRGGLLNKDAVATAVPGNAWEPVDNSDARLCAICKARLAGAGAEGPSCRRLWPCRHVYHAECIDLWLERKRICPLCRADVAVSRTETVNVMM